MSEPHHKKEHVKISNAAKFQSCRPNTSEMTDICKPKNRRQCMAWWKWLPYICLLFVWQ